ncbi:heptosyltransferase-1 [Sphaerotilus hippei]|uniref:Lipopolysaccharide heptosyltransferase 1 n=1 Tax=Sphaerotilus hippei TaxID=744406 RepID=A0A318H4V9_9BURK|nr:lipopolysaccharide heptosyltransferase I [Sphaerotilus hippei]PXW98771.1 heptosyltransferase-1 [Sphaerotilus hippei]
MRILIVKLSSLGDVIHALPVVHDLLKVHPGAQIDWVVEPGFAPLVRRVAGIGRVLECAQRRWRRSWWRLSVRREQRAFRQLLQQEAYDAVLDLQGLTKSAVVAWRARLSATGHRFALAHPTDGSGWEAPTRWVADRPIAMERHIHVVDRSRALCARALGYPVEEPPDFGLQGARVAGEAARTVVLVHGTSRDDKLWPEPLWVALGQRLVQAGWRIALPQGSEEEGARARRLAEGIRLACARPEAPGIDPCELWPRMDLNALAERMGRAGGCVGVDSGLSHLAVALDLIHVQIYNFPTAWRTGPQPSHGHVHQVSVGGEGAPTLDEVWAAWTQACERRGAARAGAGVPA